MLMIGITTRILFRLSFTVALFSPGDGSLTVVVAVLIMVTVDVVPMLKGDLVAGFWCCTRCGLQRFEGAPGILVDVVNLTISSL